MYDYNAEPEGIRKILEYMDLWLIPEQPRPPPENRFTLPQHNPCSAIREQDDFFDDGWPCYEELVNHSRLTARLILTHFSAFNLILRLEPPLL
jgi:hypothetical protein